MTSIRRHVELQRKRNDAYNFGCDLMVETVMAVCQGHWIIDGAGDPSLAVESAVIFEWGFHTEPWTFVVDGSGTVVGRFEKFTTASEIEQSLVRALEGT